MIHAKELRFGNKVQTLQGEIVTVHQILSQSLIYEIQVKQGREFGMAGSAMAGAGMAGMNVGGAATARIASMRSVPSRTATVGSAVGSTTTTIGATAIASVASPVASPVPQQAYAPQFIELVREIDYQEIEPIVLTPKILEKCGFRQFVREDWILTIGNSHYDFEFTSDGLRLRHPTPSRVSVKYLHQLQNFLYAIVGYELEADL